MPPGAVGAETSTPEDSQPEPLDIVAAGAEAEDQASGPLEPSSTPDGRSGRSPDSWLLPDVGSEDAEPELDVLEPEAVEPEGPADPLEVFGHRYWDVYRPHFLAEHFEEGRVTDRITAGQKMFGDTTVFMGLALSTFAWEWRAAGLEESKALMHQILDAYRHLDALPADPPLLYLFDDPLDGYVYRSDRGPDYETNWCQTLAPGVCLPDLATRNNEPSGDQMLGQLRALKDVVDVPGELIHEGVDLKQLAREHAERLGKLLVEDAFVIKNLLGEEVKRGPDQRWASWSFQVGAAKVSGLPKSTFEGTWHVLGLPIGPQQQKPIALTFIQGAVTFSKACESGAAIDFSDLIGLPFVWETSCNEFNIGLGGDAAVISLEADPSHPDWLSAVVPPGQWEAEGNAMYALYARYVFADPSPELVKTGALFLTAPATPPTGDNFDPFGWCTSFRWHKDFEDLEECLKNPSPFTTFSGIDYMLPRAMSAAFGEYPE